MLEEMLTPDEQEGMVKRSIFLDIIRLATAQNACYQQLVFYVNTARRAGVTDAEIKEAMKLGMEEAE